MTNETLKFLVKFRKMKFSVCVFVMFVCACRAVFPIIPEDVPMAIVGIYGFTPPFQLGRDHRVGFGFRLGNHADLQVMYEFGPQLRTKPLQPVKVRSASYRVSRRRPLLELLLRAGLLREEYSFQELELQDQPR